MDAQHIYKHDQNQYISYEPKSHFAKAIMKRKAYKHIELEHILPKTKIKLNDIKFCFQMIKHDLL
jgi:hypothetical protein